MNLSHRDRSFIQAGSTELQSYLELWKNLQHRFTEALFFSPHNLKSVLPASRSFLKLTEHSLRPSSRTRCRPRFCPGFSSQRLVVAVRSKVSQPSSAGHSSRSSSSRNSTSLDSDRERVRLARLSDPIKTITDINDLKKNDGNTSLTRGCSYKNIVLCFRLYFFFQTQKMRAT